MSSRIPDHWLAIKLRVVSGEQPTGRFSVQRSNGERVSPARSLPFIRRKSLAVLRNYSPGRASAFAESFSDDIRDDLFLPLVELVARSAEMFRASQLGSSPLRALPLFVFEPRVPLTVPLAALLRDAFETFVSAGLVEFAVPIEVIETGRKLRLPPPPISLPVQIIGVDAPELAPVFAAVKSSAQAWYLIEPDVEHTMQLTLRAQWAPALGAARADIVVTTAASLPGLARRLFASEDTLAVLPGLVVVLHDPEQPLDLPPRPLPPGVALVNLPVPLEKAVEPLRWLIEEIVHDQPLHEAVRLMRDRCFPRKEGGEHDPLLRPQLYCDPITNQNLRLSRTLPAFRVQVAPLFEMGSKPDLAAFTKNLRKRSGLSIPAKMKRALSDMENIAGDSEKHRTANINFRGEGLGLMPMSQMAAAAADVTEKIQPLVRAADEVLKSDPQFAAAFEQAQERKVDAWLSHRSLHGEIWDALSTEPLRPDEPVRLHVQIGHSSIASLIVGDVPAVDPLLPPLPDEESHELTFIVFAKDFVLEGDAVRHVRLPRFGGTAPVTWDLRAPIVTPAKPGAATIDEAAAPRRGVVSRPYAELRFSVYFKNQLLQSFSLRAALQGGEPVDAEGRFLVVKCDFSQTRRFGNLEQLTPRAASFGLNHDAGPRPATHSLTLKKDGKTAELRWTGLKMGPHTKAARDTLQKVLNNLNPPFRFDLTTFALSPQPPPSFAAAVQELAHTGRSLYDQLLLDPGNREARDIFASLRTSEDDGLQIDRLHPDAAFPWAMLYDFDRPKMPGGQPAPVCRGVTDSGARCDCATSPTGWCVRGFWGFRFVLEQRCPGLSLAPHEKPGVIAPARTNPTLGLLAAVKDPFLDHWVATLEASPPLTHVVHRDPQEIFKLIHDPATRPPLLIYVGHHGDLGPPELPAPQLELADRTPILTLSDLTNVVNNPEWKLPPRSLVLLLACGSGVDRADTGTSLALTLHQLGAVGVLSTECTVLTGIVTRIARDLTLSLAAGHNMGVSIHRAIRDLAMEGCPLGLAFTYVGSTDARLPESSP